MPKANRRKTQSRSASARRWENSTIPSPADFSNDEYHAEVEDLKLDFMHKLTLSNIEDLGNLCRSKCSSKYLSVLLYMTLRHFKINWEDIDAYLRSIGFMTAETSHKWADTFLNGDLNDFLNDSRGGKHSDSFYDRFPEIEADAKAFVAEACSKKSGEFKALDLAQFINTKYHELNDTGDESSGLYVRSERSCRLDLRRWGAKFEANAQRPYFEGHEREDVVKHRNEFINYFLERKAFYYTITDGEIPTWNTPVKNPRVLLCK